MAKRTLKFMATALIFLAIGGAASAQQCSTQILNGWYDSSFHTVRLGLLTGSPPTLAPFPTQSIVDGVSVYAFDGEGKFVALDFAMRDGQPNVPAGSAGLTPDGFAPQTGTYHINPDCTGAGSLSSPGLSFTFVIVLGDRGKIFHMVTTSAHAASIPGNPDCANGCNLAIQSYQQGEKIIPFYSGD